MIQTKIGQVVSCAPECIVIELDSIKIFEENKASLQIGKYLQIAQGNNDFTLAIIRNIKGLTNNSDDHSIDWTFTIECQAIGNINSEGVFSLGSILLPVPTEPVFLPDENTMRALFAENAKYCFKLGNLSYNKQIPLFIDGNGFFSKHIGIVGSTGSGKSCTVAKILQSVVGINNKANSLLGKQNNSHIVMFDIHDEYSNAFSLDETQSFTLNRLDVDSLQLPYWLMNSEELESMFIESNEQNSHNQVSQFKIAVILDKEKHNPELKNITYDTPVFFSITEVYRYIENMNREVIGRLDGENKPKLSDGTLVNDRKDLYFDKIYEFVSSSTAKDTKATNGPFNGEFNRFVSRLETRLNDKRLRFLLHPQKKDGSTYCTEDFHSIMMQFIGYINKANITVIDLSGIPFEVLSISVSLISRLIFDFCFHYSKLRHSIGLQNDIPLMIVCEEAHNYVPQKDDASYRASKESIERIAKEGRKYGISLMVVSQRPSEVSSTIYAQCNNFIALRLTNSDDQSYIKKLLPDNTNGITDILPNLSPGQAIVVGDATIVPTIVQMEKPNPEPHSQSVKFQNEWNELWRSITFEDVINRWRK